MMSTAGQLDLEQLDGKSSADFCRTSTAFNDAITKFLKRKVGESKEDVVIFNGKKIKLSA